MGKANIQKRYKINENVENTAGNVCDDKQQYKMANLLEITSVSQLAGKTHIRFVNG